MHRRLKYALITACVVNSGVAIGQVSNVENDLEAASVIDADGVTSYPATFFAAQSPVSALDLVEAVPGFSFQDSEQTRGFSGAAGNVLIDGQRPSAKSVSLRNVLQRLPVSVIERVEVVRAGAAGYNTLGHPVVVNVIRSSEATTALAVELWTKVYTDGGIAPIAKAEWSRRAGDLTIDTAFHARTQKEQDESGDGRLEQYDQNGALISDENFSAEYWERILQGTAALEYRRGEAVWRGNVGYDHSRNDFNEYTDFVQQSGGYGLEAVRRDFQSDEIEFGGDYERSLGDNVSGQLMVLQRVELDEETERSEDGLDTVRSSSQELAGETILRGLARWTPAPATSFEAGIEGAYNFLDAESNLTSNGQPIILPSANVLVEERRAEAFTTLNYRPAGNLALELGLRHEFSQIEVSGDVDQDNEFTFTKPRIIASYEPLSGTQLRLRVEREAGQLDFEDFAASSDLGGGFVNAGNPDLAPEHFWIYEGAIEQRFLGSGAITLTASQSDVSDVQDFVPLSNALGDKFDAPGNIGDAVRRQLNLALSLPLDQFGPGLGRLQLQATWRESEVVDPVTGQSRRLSGERPTEAEFTYTRDFPSLNSTFVLAGNLPMEETDYRLDQIRKTSTGSYLKVYWDWRPTADLFIRTQVENFSAREYERDRLLYTGSRATGTLIARDVRTAKFDPFVLVRVRKEF